MKKYIPYIAIILIGFIAAGFSYAKLASASLEEKKTARVVVPVADIAPYCKISPKDLGFKEVLYDDAIEDMVTDPYYAIGKYANTQLYAGWPIKKGLLAEGDAFLGKDIVAVSVDYARSAGAKPGDVVDVYYVMPQASSPSVRTAEKVASDAVVVKVEGTELKAGSASSVGTAVLAVDKSFTQLIVPGALKDSSAYVLAVKQPFEAQEGEGGK